MRTSPDETGSDGSRGHEQQVEHEQTKHWTLWNPLEQWRSWWYAVFDADEIGKIQSNPGEGSGSDADWTFQLKENNGKNWWCLGPSNFFFFLLILLLCHHYKQ